MPVLADGSSRHCAFNCIEPSTLCGLLRGEFADRGILRTVVIDARYPFEYEGGRIRGAINIWTDEMLIDYFFTEDSPALRNADQVAFVFHCEFSSQRAPALLSRARNLDRHVNADCYPKLLYPELYLLAGGYRRFFSEAPECCSPRAYVLMEDRKFAIENTESYRKLKQSKKASQTKEEGVVRRLKELVAQGSCEPGVAAGETVRGMGELTLKMPRHLSAAEQHAIIEAEIKVRVDAKVQEFMHGGGRGV